MERLDMFFLNSMGFLIVRKPFRELCSTFDSKDFKALQKTLRESSQNPTKIAYINAFEFTKARFSWH